MIITCFSYDDTSSCRFDEIGLTCPIHIFIGVLDEFIGVLDEAGR